MTSKLPGDAKQSNRRNVHNAFIADELKYDSTYLKSCASRVRLLLFGPLARCLPTRTLAARRLALAACHFGGAGRDVGCTGEHSGCGWASDALK